MRRQFRATRFFADLNHCAGFHFATVTHARNKGTMDANSASD